MNKQQKVTIVHDNDVVNKSYIDIVKQYYDVQLVDQHNFSIEDIKQSLLIIIQVNLTNPDSLRPLKEKMACDERQHVPVLFLLNQFSRREIVQATMLGATDYIAYPCPHSNLMGIIGDLINRTIEKAWSKLSHAQEMALKVSLKVVEDTFKNAAGGFEVSQDDVKNSCNLIIEATSKDGITDWMQAIRHHHNYTYRHSMMVCGYLISFGMLLGINNSEIQQLAVGGMLHDIGKSLTPLDLLDKPAQLTPEEWVVMKKHPGNGRLILQENNWDEVMIDIACHHHEKLDGTGYPDGLENTQISDMARMAAISDVFSGLTDKRSYKAAMTSEKAIEIMLTMEGHLDMPLVRAFREFILSQKSA